MAYIPSPVEHDVFLSYAREDATWVNALQERLTERLRDRLAYRCDVWQDKNNIRTGQKWTVELDKAVRASAAFVAVLSRNYQNSKWCESELDAFLDQSGKDGWETGGYGRVLKIIKFPWLYDAHEGFLGEYQHVPFFERDSKTGQEREFKHTSESFRKAVDKLSFHIESLFQAMLRGRERAFVARAPADAADERDALIREIRAAGYALSPPPEGAIPKGLDAKVLRRFIADAGVSVHIIGGAGDDSIRSQIDLSLDAGKKVFFYFAHGHASASGEHARLIDDIRENKWGLAEGTWSLLEGRSPAILRQELIGLLKPGGPMMDAAQSAGMRVYVLCDPTSPEDAGFGREIQAQIHKREAFEVELTQPAAESHAPADRHEHLLEGCDGLLLYRQKAPDRWYQRNFADLLTADDRKRSRALRSKALLVAGSTMVIPGLTVIERREPFDIGQLEPFLAPLRIASGQGGSVHAGG